MTKICLVYRNSHHGRRIRDEKELKLEEAEAAFNLHCYCPGSGDGCHSKYSWAQRAEDHTLYVFPVSLIPKLSNKTNDKKELILTYFFLVKGETMLKKAVRSIGENKAP